jgi:hypothetical protein
MRSCNIKLFSLVWLLGQTISAYMIYGVNYFRLYGLWDKYFRFYDLWDKTISVFIIYGANYFRLYYLWPKLFPLVWFMG